MIKPKKQIIGEVDDFKNMEFVAKVSGVITKVEEVADVKKQLADIKFNYEALLKFTVDLLTHEQHVKFAAKKKEIFG